MRRFPIVILATMTLTAMLWEFSALAQIPGAVPPKPITWSTQTGMDNNIFPSATISTATSKDPFIYLLATVANAPAGAKIKVSVTCDTFIEPSSTEVIAKDAAPIMVAIKGIWKFDKLAAVHQQIPASFVYSLSIDGRVAGQKTDIANIHSVNDCIFLLKDGAGVWKPFGPLFTAYVNEDHPKIDKLLKDALATGIVKQFDGYQSKDPKQVTLQVFAIWESLQLKGIKYSSIAAQAEKPEPFRAQHVRFLDESVDNAQANCVDGSVILASILQRIGIESSLVITTSHMFIIYFSDPEKKTPVPLETTILGQINLPSDPRNNALIVLDPQWRSKASAKSFLAAVQAGADETAKLIEAEKKQKESGGNDFVDQMINISDARKAGITPIPYDYTKKAN